MLLQDIAKQYSALNNTIISGLESLAKTISTNVAPVQPSGYPSPQRSCKKLWKAPVHQAPECNAHQVKWPRHTTTMFY